MGFLRSLLQAAIAVAVVTAFVTFAIYSVENSRRVSPKLIVQPDQSAHPLPSPQADIVQAPGTTPELRSPEQSIESARQACIDEMKSTSTLALGARFNCDNYASMLSREFATVRPGPTHVDKYSTAAPRPARSIESPHSIPSVPQREFVADADVDRICGNRFDDFNGRNLAELQRRYRHRTDSLTRADHKELRELKCRMQYATS